MTTLLEHIGQAYDAQNASDDAQLQGRIIATEALLESLRDEQNLRRRKRAAAITNEFLHDQADGLRRLMSGEQSEDRQA